MYGMYVYFLVFFKKNWNPIFPYYYYLWVLKFEIETLILISTFFFVTNYYANDDSFFRSGSGINGSAVAVTVINLKINNILIIKI